ncbi:hypothetical protein Mp_4g09820 [Marchantia polymorpha subsp. ruderalis]|uniref:Uncharacterized protein n=2 Tax=Marchantia polymorpha TaxID=3197 RepID=A0AAF6B886_MARPO|nr:hypothetical protein MARPO_0132s0025 [Marchantia polymorpha]BBN08220.1 hypothetical protein Mp_4g09820 [Marchantia polymorpha subsp. ruderalis]|eukprot:PTQ29950.1 hypothetical protein MARPO_0132s0025 [Marchantia polymorpha]
MYWSERRRSRQFFTGFCPEGWMGRDSTGNRSTEQRSHSQASKGLSGFDSELLREKWELPDLLNPNLRDTPARERVGEHVTLPVWTTLAPHHLTIAPRACTAAAANCMSAKDGAS